MNGSCQTGTLLMKQPDFDGQIADSDAIFGPDCILNRSRRCRHPQASSKVSGIDGIRDVAGDAPPRGGYGVESGQGSEEVRG